MEIPFHPIPTLSMAEEQNGRRVNIMNCFEQQNGRTINFQSVTTGELRANRNAKLPESLLSL